MNNDALLQVLWNQSHDILFISDTEGNITKINQNFTNLFGYQQEEVTGSHFNILYPEKDRSSAKASFANYLNQNKKPSPESFIFQSKSQKPIQLHSKMEMIIEKNETIGFLHILNENPGQSAESISNSNQNLLNFFNSLQDMLVVITSDDQVVYGNNALFEKTGYNLEELNEIGVLGMHPEEKRVEAQEIVTAMLQGKRDFCPLPLQAKDGKLIPVETRIYLGEWDGKPCMYGSIKDLSKEQILNQKFEQLFRINPTPLAISNARDRTFIDVNEAFINSFGYSREDIIGKTSTELNLFPDKDNHLSAVRQLKNKGQLKFHEAKVRCKNGSIRDGLFFGNIIRGVHHDSFLTVMVDVTEQNELADSLKRQSQLREILIETAKDFINIPLELLTEKIQQSLKQMSSFINADRAYIFEYNWDKKMAIKTHEWSSLPQYAFPEKFTNIPFEIIKPILEEHKKAKAINISNLKEWQTKSNNAESIQLIENSQAKSQLTVPLMYQQECIGFIGFDSIEKRHNYTTYDQELLQVFAEVLSNVKIREEITRDLTEALQNLEEHQIKLKQSQSIAKLGGWEYQVDKDEFTFTDSAYELFHTNAKQMGGYRMNLQRYMDLFMLPDEKQLIDEEIKKAIQNDVENYSSTTEHRFKYYDGGYGDLKAKFYVRKNEKGEISSTYGIIQDITEEKKIKNELIQAKEHAEESDRLKSAFLATMNHELRTPLNHILGLAQIIPDITEDQNIIEYSGLIFKSGTSLLNMIENIFDLAMIEKSNYKIKKQKTSVKDIYLELKELLQKSINESKKNHLIQSRFHIDSQHIASSIEIDKDKTLQVMTNLIKNAVKFTDEGYIYIKITIQNSNRLILSLEDTGIGIPEDKRELIFDFFRQGDDSHTRKYGGAGIGLAISGKLAHAMGGEIMVDSEPDKGSVFTLEIPIDLHQYTSNKSSDKQQMQHYPDFSHHTILLADDDQIGSDMVETMLSPTHCKLIKASNGQEALNTCKKNSNIDLILMDIKMPVMDGIEATRLIRVKDKKIPVFAFTAHSFSQEIQNAKDAGCNLVITKPVNKNILLNHLQEFLK